ncbi:MAG TPA: hypothetical protein VNM67_07600 [Thermoanaerobaculia bacterium]|jgi:hypothetical protein|nr:hypothetical protein [Thermoanaerobaculia bacterium]
MSEKLSRRHFVLAAGAAATWLSAETATATELTGKWKVQLQWPDRIAVDVIWTVNRGGRFTSSDGFNGVWARRGDLVVFAVHGGSEPSYAGTLSGTDLEGVSVERNGKRGFWSATLQP